MKDCIAYLLIIIILPKKKIGKYWNKLMNIILMKTKCF